MSLEASESAPAETGALSIDDGASLLSVARKAAPAAGPVEDDEEEAHPDGEEREAGDQPAVEEDAPAEEPASEDDLDEDEDEEAEPETPATLAPEFWSAEEKATFAKAPPEVQQLVAAKTAEAEKRVYSAKEEAAAARKEASTVTGELRQAVDQQLQRASAIFADKWEGIDWAEWSRQDPTAAFQGKIEFDAEQEEIQRLQTASAATEVEEHRLFIRGEAQKLADAGHELADPVKGPALKKDLVEYAEKLGFQKTDLKWAGALELQVLHKAMLRDRDVDRLANKKPSDTPPPNKDKAAKPGVRPSAQPVQGSQRRRIIEAAQTAFEKDPSTDNALALMKAKRK